MRRCAPVRPLIALAAALLLGCAFAIDPVELGQSCRFSGRETDCGACLVARCQPLIDACCLSASCGGLVDVVERCAAQSDQACDEIRAAVVSANESARTHASGPRADLARCVSERCRGVCENAPGASESACSDTRFGYQSACTCRAPSGEVPANRYQCDMARFPSTRCCATSGWPSAGNACTCSIVTCTTLRNGCSCYLSDAFDPNAERECRGPICCQGPRSCRCGPDACDADEVAVGACGVENTPCPEQSRAVVRCSLP